MNKLKNNNPFEPWNGVDKNNPFAPWNDITKRNNPFACWNNPFGYGEYEDEAEEWR